MTQYNFLQWKFTACRYNLNDRNGFYTFSMSEGLTRDDEEELIRRAGSYEKPSNLPYAPTAEEIRDLFPVRWLSFRLRSGKYAVVRTGYVGDDYAGDKRGGNFFSHALVYPASVMPFAPILLWNSPLFAAGLSEEELSIKTVPPLLPQVSVSENDLYNFAEKLPDFLADASRKENLLPLIQAVRNENTGKRIILRDNLDNVPLWIAAVQLALPFRLACDVTFSTLAIDLSAARNYHIAAVPLEGSRFALDSSVKAANFVFDFPKNDTAKVDVPSKEYLGNITTDEMTYPGKTLQTMLLFISQFNCLLSGTSLEIAATLDRLTKSNDRLNQQQLEAVLKFCDDQPAEKKTELLTSILKKEQRYDADELKLFVPVLLKVLNEQQNDNFVKIFLFQFFYRQFQMPLDQRFVPENCRMLFSIIDSFVSSEAVRQRFLRSDYLTQLQKQNKPDDVFLYLSLCFCLYGKDTTELFDRFSLCPKLEHRTDRKLFEAMFSSVVSKAVNSKTHQVIIEWGMRAAGAEYLNDSKAKFDVRELYIKELRKYGTQNWKDGKNAQPQAAAFIVYLFETQKERRSQWGFGGNIQKIFGGSDYIKNSSQKKTVYETVQRQIGKTYDGAVLEHFRTLIVGYRTRWEKTKYRIESCWNAMDEFIQDHWIKILVVVCIIAISVTCWLYRSDIETHLHSWISSNSSPGTDQNGNSEGQGTKEPQPQEQPKK